MKNATETPEKQNRAVPPMIDRAQELIRTGRAKIIGSGRSAEVYLLNIWDGKTEKPWVIKSEERRTQEQRALDTSLSKEMKLHDRAYQLVAKAREEHPETPYAVIPKPLSIIVDEERGVNWSLIEFLPGDNLTSHVMRNYLLTIETNDEEAQKTIAKMTPEELSEALLSDAYCNLLPPRMLEEYNTGKLDTITHEHTLMLATYYTKILSREPLLTENQYRALENTLMLWHKNRFYHRDLQPGNIMVLPDGNIAIIDFGLSADRRGIEEGSIYDVDVGEGVLDRTVKLPRDIVMLEAYKKLARIR